MNVKELYERLYNLYGPQHWWPADSFFEVIIGAILTQNTSWKNVEKAIINLKKDGCLDAKKIINCKNLEELIRPTGFYNQKAERLRVISSIRWEVIKDMSTKRAREYLLNVRGIGKETADSILLYALDKEIFIIDAYTRRIYNRIILGDEGRNWEYDELREIFENEIRGLENLKEMHALIVEHGKRYCTKKRNKCDVCPIRSRCKIYIREKEFVDLNTIN